MENKVTLSVVVLSYNNEQYLEDCLSSIERQGIDSYEVFVIDDSSTDNSVEVIKEYIKDKPQFNLIVKPNSGGAISSQIGIAKANGKYLALVDSDDIVADGAYKKLIARIEQDGSDFASGLPMKLTNAFMNTFLISPDENNVFVENRVLSTDEEIENFTNQVFYWNAVYKTDFLRSNHIEMPANLLIADRIFVYKAAMRAKKISVLTDVVYFWRKKKNDEKISLTDQTAEYHMISDRCDSFQSQIKLSIQDFEKNLDYNKAIWEHSVIRLYYPLYNLADEENEENTYQDFVDACNRYRFFLMQYKAFFIHLLGNSDMPVTTKYITDRIFAKRYKQIYNFIHEKKWFTDLNVKTLEPYVYNSVLRSNSILSVKGISNENDRIYIDLQIYVGLEDKEKISVENVFVYTRYFNQKKIELPYNEVDRKVDITELPCSTYVLNTICIKDEEKTYYTPRLTEELAKVTTLTVGDKIITFNSRYSILTIQQKNRFTLLKDGNKYLLGVNKSEDIKKLFFFNIENNKKYDVTKEGDFYTFSKESLQPGDNILMYETQDGNYTTVRKQEMTNSNLDKDLFDEVIISGRVEIEV